MNMNVIEGSGKSVLEPDWSETYSDQEVIAAAKEQWRLLERAMVDAGTLAPENAPLMERYVNFKLVYDRANKTIAEKGIIIPPRRGSRSGIARQHPSWVTMRECAADLDRMESLLGISPRYRDAAGKVNKTAARKNAADAYLRPIAK